MHTTLVTTAQLAAEPQWRVFDCRHDLGKPQLGEQQYREAHIPGALFAHLDRDLSAPKTGANGRHPLPDRGAFIAWLGQPGEPPTERPSNRGQKSSCFWTRARRRGFAASRSRSTRSPAASPARRTASAMTTWARKEFSRNRSSSGTNFALCSVIAPRKKSSATADRAWRRATISLQWSLPDCAAASFTPARGASGLQTRRDRAKRVDEADSSW